MSGYSFRPNPGFQSCAFCYGRGCLACDAVKARVQKEREAEYEKRFPNGPEPIFTASLATDDELNRMADDGCPNNEPLSDFRSRMSQEDLSGLSRLLGMNVNSLRMVDVTEALR